LGHRLATGRRAYENLKPGDSGRDPGHCSIAPASGFGPHSTWKPAKFTSRTWPNGKD